MWGKVLGTLFGFLFGRIVGALLGLYVGHLFDKGMRQFHNPQGGFNRYFNISSHADRQAIFFYSTFSVMGHIAKSNGRVTQIHIQAANLLMEHMGLNEEQKREAQTAFRDGKTSGFDLTGTLQDFRRSVFSRREILQMFVEIQIQGAFSDAVIDPREHAILLSVAKTLGFSEAGLAKLIARWEAEVRFHQQQHQGHSQSRPLTKQALDDAYRLLGVGEDSSAAEIKKAYKKQMNQHHPDKLVSKGLPPEMLEMAKIKAQDIQAAYDMVRHR